MQNIKELGKTLIRNVCANFTKLRLIPPPLMRENKISVTIRVKNEVDWIDYCLLSFKDFADEIIIADHGSTDGSVQKIQYFIKNHSEIPIQLYDRSEDSYLELSNFLILKAKYRWIMRVDADHIAKTSGKYNILKLKNRILNLKSEYYYAIRLNHVFLLLDLFHAPRIRPRHKEIWLINYSPDLVCIREGLYTDKFWVPLYYKVLEFPEPFIFHVNVRPKIRHLERIYWGPWRQEGSGVPFAEYLKKRIKTDFSTSLIEEAADKYLNQIFVDVEPFNAANFDGYPDVLKKCLQNPTYKLIYEGGKIIKRIENPQKERMNYKNF